MYKFCNFLSSLGILIVLVGCGDQRILEKLGFTQTTSYDLVPSEKVGTQEKLMITVTIPKTDPESANKRETLTAISATSKSARIMLDRKTELFLVSGQLRNTLFGLNLAKQGIWEHIDTLVRDPAISQRVKITVVNGNAHNLLIKDYAQHPRTGKYIDRMIEKEGKSQTVPPMTLYEFTRDYFDDGIDPVAPIIKERNKDIVIDGIALFNKDRYITKIEADKSLIFALLRGNFKQGDLSVDLITKSGKSEEHVMLSSLISKRNIKVYSNDLDHIIININIKLNGSILEYIGDLHISENSDRQKLETMISKFIENETSVMIAQMQKNEVDSLGLGKHVRNSLSYSEWKYLNWKKLYPNVKVRCSVQIKIKDYGKFEK